VSRIYYIARIDVDHSVADKIRTKHNVTLEEVREAFVMRTDMTANWEDSAEHGGRLIVTGTTYLGRRLLAPCCRLIRPTEYGS
jgi:hypothetical protein